MIEISDAPKPQEWPKFCSCCSRTFTQGQWNGLTLLGYAGAVRSGGKLYACELRTCVCTTTLAIEVELPLNSSEPAPEPESKQLSIHDMPF